MDGNIDKVREALIGSRFIIDKFTMGTHPALKKIDEAIAAISAIDPEDNALKVGRYFCAQMPCSPSDCDGVPCRYMKNAIANRNNRDPDAIRRECARVARNAIFDFGIGNKASNYYSPIIRKELAVQLVERAILGAEPAQDDKGGHDGR